MRNKKKIIFLGIILIFLISLFLFLGLNRVIWRYALSLRFPKLIVLLLVGSSLAFGATVFQTISNNRILTPSILGLDSLYLFVQSFVVFVFGSSALIQLGERGNFIISVAVMSGFSLILFKVLFKREKHNIFFLLLMGLIFGTLFQSMATFMQVLLDPNEFLIVQNRMFASFNNVNRSILWTAFIGIAFSLFLVYKDLKTLDVLSLGRENAINLGVDYDRIVKKLLIIISVLISISTALVGPITFLGLLVVNLTKEFFKTYKHHYLLLGSMLISSIALVGSQLVAERILDFSTPISIIINFIGGIYFIYLILKESRI